MSAANGSGDLGLIPFPSEIDTGAGFFQFNEDSSYAINAPAPEAARAAAYLSEHLQERYGLMPAAGAAGAGIQLNATAGAQHRGPKGYRLEASPTGISISASSESGLFHGVVTLIQLLDEGEKRGHPRSVPTVHVEDAPRYAWRGMMLDVGRHFFPVEFIKRYLDLMAMHKMNVFHWHLTEDSGWRIEIARYPRLTEVGAWRAETLVGSPRDEPRQFDGVPHGGFYTQDQIREVVSYAESRCIEVVPEIELPGHCVAALAAYPELSCTGGPFEVSPNWGIHRDVYCAGNEKTFEFLEEVLAEVIELFPSPYVHIGGDECPKDRWRAHDLDQRRIAAEGLNDEDELQSYFIKRVQRFLRSSNRRLLGWDEILQGGLAPDATVMSWRGVDGGIAAANAGHDVVMTPTSHCYFDYYQSELRANEPLAHPSVVTLEQAYGFEPTPPEIDPDQAHHVLGGQGNVWTEFIPTTDLVEYMSLPRMSAMA